MINVTSDSERDGMMTDLAPDLTPLLDVMFMLIIFLVLTTNTMQQAFDVSLPEDSEQATTPINNDKSITITIFAEDNNWAIGEEKFSDFTLLKAALLEAKMASPDKEFIIFSDKTATIDKLMGLLTFMRVNGIEAADIVME